MGVPARAPSNSWAGTISRSRRKSAEHIGENPGLKSRRSELFAKAFPDGRADAAIEANLPLEHFPAVNPYTLDQATDEEFWPRGRDMPESGAGKRRS